MKSVWSLSFDSIFRNDWICLHMSPASRIKHTWLTCCLSALPLALRVHSSASAQEGTRGTPNLEITRAGPREAQSLQGHLRARSRNILNKEQGQTPLLAEHDRDSGLALLRAFWVKIA